LLHRLIAAPLALAAVPLAAQSQPERGLAPTLQGRPAEDRYSLTFGLGAAVTPSYTGSDDYQVNPGGIIRGRVDGFNFTLVGLNLYVDALRDDGRRTDVQFGPVVGLNLNRVNRIGDARVRALGELDPAVEVGGYVGIARRGILTSSFDALTVSLAYQRDVTDTHESWRLTPQIGYSTPLTRTILLAVSVDATIVGDRFARTYFGVTPAGAAASGLPAYDLGGGVQDVGVNIVLAKSLSRDIRRGWSIFGIAGYSRLLGDFERSPIVRIAGDPNQLFGAAGIAYTF
jgi:MipA family protein